METKKKRSVRVRFIIRDIESYRYTWLRIEVRGMDIALSEMRVLVRTRDDNDHHRPVSVQQ